MAINITNMEFDIEVDASLMESGIVRVSCVPADNRPDTPIGMIMPGAITEFLARIVVRNISRFNTIYSEQFDNVNVGAVITAVFRPENVIKNSTFSIIVQAKATLNSDGEEIIQRDFFTKTINYFAAADISTNNFAVRYNTVRNSYLLTAEATLAYSGYESLRVLCIIRDASNSLLLENYLSYNSDPNNIHRILIRQDLGAFGFPASWYLENPCTIRLSYEYI